MRVYLILFVFQNSYFYFYRPKKKRDGEVIPAATPVKRRHSDEEEHKDTESEVDCDV